VPEAIISRTVPKLMLRPYLVLGPDGERLGLVQHPEQIAKLLAGDPTAGVCQTRRGFVQLGDIDAWLCLTKHFTIQTYLPEAFTVVSRAACGRKFYELKSSRHCSWIA
jgi:hypothetical protein